MRTTKVNLIHCEHCPNVEKQGDRTIASRYFRFCCKLNGWWVGNVTPDGAYYYTKGPLEAMPKECPFILEYLLQ